MFTGIIREIGALKGKIVRSDGNGILKIACRKINAKLGNSIAVNGICLTVTKKIPGGFEADIVEETFKRTHIGRMRIKEKLNLEPSMRLGDSISGHIVTGHIDAASNVLSNRGGKLIIELPRKLAPYIVEKGSVAVNGVSLTVSAAAKNTFTVALIPFTQKHTNLGALKKNNIVNIEVDILARYAYRNHRLSIQ